MKNLAITLLSLAVATAALCGQAEATPLPNGTLEITVYDVKNAVRAGQLTLDAEPDGNACCSAEGIETQAQIRALEAGVEVTVVVRDTTGQDRALDLEAFYPIDLTGWTRWLDINTSQVMASFHRFKEKRYPFLAVSPPQGDTGLCMGVHPTQPFLYEIIVDASGITLKAPLGLTPLGEGPVKSRAEITFYIFPIPAAHGFRGALALYYSLFPEAFERRAMAEGMWLFSFPTEQLPNPHDYAYREGGPNGWKIDERLGIGTYPYTEVSSRTIAVPRLPADRQEALEIFAEMQTGINPAAWYLRGATVDSEVSRTGQRSLKCSKTDPQEWVGASQDIMVNQQRAEPITITGWLKAEGVTGFRGRECSLYADVLLIDGSWAFGRIVDFSVGTHDWQKSSMTFYFDRPVKMVRLHCLFRRGHTGTVWFDDITVTTASRPDENLCLNPGFEIHGTNLDIDAINAYALHAADNQPVFLITTHMGADVSPETPQKLLRFTLNPSPFLRQAEGVELPPGPKEIARYVNMIEAIPAIDGAYIDSVSSWATAHNDFRREHFYCNRNPFTYDPTTKQVVAAGRYYTWHFLDQLQKQLNPLGKWVFTNIHNTMDTFLLYTVSDIPGIESSITSHERFAYIRSASYQKPALLLNFLNLHDFDKRSKHEYHWRMSVLYGLYPSIGRRCDEAYALYGDLYRRFMPSLKSISAAGWQPITHAMLEPAGPYIERFGQSPKRGLYFTVYNENRSPYEGVLIVDAEALGIRAGEVVQVTDTTTGASWPAEFADGQLRAFFSIAAEDVAVLQLKAE
ncbi:MAG: hypothetical protein GX162_09580 [Firmicutes bacterium]|nr:hypothetical protein [Bacillota bacterium]